MFNSHLHNNEIGSFMYLQFLYKKKKVDSSVCHGLWRLFIVCDGLVANVLTARLVKSMEYDWVIHPSVSTAGIVRHDLWAISDP